MATCKSLLRACPSQRQTTTTTTFAAAFLPFTQTRHESSTRRHRKLLALPSSPSYTPSSSDPTLVFNPPSSAPNVYHTPLKFLPKSDARRALYASAAASSTLAAQRLQTSHIAAPGTPLQTTGHTPPRPSAALPAPVRAPYEKKYHVTPAQMAEMRQLRARDPDKWTRVRLAEKYGCSQFFVGMVAKNEEKAERVERAHRRERKGWGRIRREAREDRVRRKEGWGRDA